MNEYASLSRLKAECGVPMTERSYDAALLRMTERISRAWDTLTRRRYFTKLETRRWDGANDRYGSVVGMWAPVDIASLTTLKVDDNDDGVYELTLVSGTDYRLVRLREEDPSPYCRIDLIPRGTQLSSFPRGFETVQAVGYFGFSDETETLTAVVGTGGITASAVSLPLPVGHVDAGDFIGPGDTLVIGTEHIAVLASIDSTHVTIKRGINGTTAAIQADGAAMTRRRFPREIEEATIMQVARLFRESKGGFSSQAGDATTGVTFNALWAPIRDLIKPYMQPGVA